MGARRLIFRKTSLPPSSYTQVVYEEEPVLIQPSLEHREH